MGVIMLDTLVVLYTRREEESFLRIFVIITLSFPSILMALVILAIFGKGVEKTKRARASFKEFK